MKTIRFAPAAARALRQLPAMARGDILADLNAYADDSTAFADVVAPLAGIDARRLRTGAFRVIFRETTDVVIVLDIGHRGEIYGRWPR